LCEVMDYPAWAEGERYRTAQGRYAHRQELDLLLEFWTSQRTPEECMETLQRAAVPAGVVQNARDLMEKDPHLRARQLFVAMDHAEVGPYTCESLPYKFSDSPVEVRHAAPLLGEHTEYIAKDLLGLSEAEFARLLVDGA